MAADPISLWKYFVSYETPMGTSRKECRSQPVATCGISAVEKNHVTEMHGERLRHDELCGSPLKLSSTPPRWDISLPYSKSPFLPLEENFLLANRKDSEWHSTLVWSMLTGKWMISSNVWRYRRATRDAQRWWPFLSSTATPFEIPWVQVSGHCTQTRDSTNTRGAILMIVFVIDSSTKYGDPRSSKLLCECARL